MSQLAKVTKGMLCFGDSRRRRTGLIYLEDGKTPCNDVYCEEGMVVKDIIDEVCSSHHTPILPVVRPLLALCDVKTGGALCHTQFITKQQAAQQYQLKVFVNAGDNSTCLRKYSRAARNYYYTQLRADFVNGKLKHQLANSAGLQMAAIDMVLDMKITGRKIGDGNITEHFKVSDFMPSYLKEQTAWKVTLDLNFNEYSMSLMEKDVEIIKGQYIHIYESDIHCGVYQFSGKLSVRRGVFLDVKIFISGKNGLVIKSTVKKETFPLVDIDCVSANMDGCQVTVCFRPTAEGEATPPNKTLMLKSTGDVATMCSVIDSYFHLKVDVNRCVVGGDLAPPTDPHYFGRPKLELCHGPISDESAEAILQRSRLEEGNFLIRESRSKDKTYILSLCHENVIKNYRISPDHEGRFALVDTSGLSPVPKTVNSCYNLHDLVNHHHHFKDGLPVSLKRNYPPKDTGAIPLFPVATPTSATDTDSVDEEDSEAVAAVVKKGVLRIDYKKHILLGKELGSGHFSSVHSAEWFQPGGKKPIKVAIKIPNFPHQSSEAHGILGELIKEILTMYDLDHPNIVKLLGVTCPQHFLAEIGQFPMIVMEYINGGNLRGQLDKYSKRTMAPPKDWQQLYLRYSVQIAEGMHYLGTKSVVHRDLATRNVLVVSDEHIKIADFGLARQFVENKDYYKSKGGNDLPVYWYAPECLESFVFSEASDVWSFGVTLWEMFTLGHRPQEFLEPVVHRAQTNRQPPLAALTRHFKVSNFRLPHLPSYPSSVYDLIKKHCWNIHPEQRLPFIKLMDMLTTEQHRMQLQ